MNILCWNTNEDVWKHWKQIVSSSVVLARVETLADTQDALSMASADFRYCFVYLDDQNFSKQVEEVVALRLAFPQQKLIVFPNQSSQSAALRLFSVGVNGQCAPYIGKEQLSLVLSVIDSGEIWGGKAFIQQLIMQSAGVSSSADGSLRSLSEREWDVAQYVAKGLSNKHIASAMNITERTVKAHLTSIFKKTDTKDRLSLALLAKRYDTAL
ncbi:response regulator transcription factor [Marinomonas sp. M1K-6]|uniref:Response regulator transcription factor n=1 Tax=Marinomonas profundi TaxID=2726122 RepID=A0A847R784_9GAMM|nr:response regulator transcription factor [Marinomonas profundi]NLQ16120.1 response regulator transcription factor [Marinomonas profundi]UDV03295.1 response regulator transcription factor [Marinomonas profundi]